MIEILENLNENKILQFICPVCTNKTLGSIEQDVYNVRDINYHEIFVCDECGEEFYAVPQYDGNVRFEINSNLEESKKIITIKNESNHIDILETDYKTGESLFNALKNYLDSLDQISMEGKDWNWQPSEFNAKNLEADGEIYLVSGSYILIYPYINEWQDDYFKVIVMEANDLNNMIKNSIRSIFDKYKTDKWKLIFEG